LEETVANILEGKPTGLPDPEPQPDKTQYDSIFNHPDMTVSVDGKSLLGNVSQEKLLSLANEKGLNNE